MSTPSRPAGTSPSDHAPSTAQGALATRANRYEELLQLFVQAPGFVCFFRGPEHVYELANEAHAQLAQHKDIMGKSVREAFPELAEQGYFKILDDVYNSGQAFVGHALPLAIKPAPDIPAEQRFIDLVYQPIYSQDGEVIGIFSQGHDVTDRVLAETALKERQAELERLIEERTNALGAANAALELARKLQIDKMHLLQLFEQAPGFTAVILGADHRFEIANQAYYRLVGGRNLIGRTVREALPELIDQGFFELLDQVYVTGEPYIGRSIAATLQANPDVPSVTLYLDFIYQPILGADGKPIGIFVQGNDVTSQKNAQDEVRRYQNDLEKMIAERTVALDETRAALAHAQKLESVGKLTGGVAHDFNNILQVIGGNLHLLRAMTDNNPATTKRLEIALRAVDRGAKLSGQLLAFARRQPLQPAVINLARTVRNMDDMLRRALGEAIDIEIIGGGGLWNTQVDPGQLENVLLNLALNSRDAMNGCGKLTIEIANAMLDDEYIASIPDIKPGQYVVLSVSDTGAGMTPDVLEQAIEPFFTTKPPGDGTGLGLSMAYGFVKQSGGHFKIYSEPGVGTTVRIYLPRSLEREDATPDDMERAVVGGSETILVVEDDKDVQLTVVSLLQELGYQVLKADDAESALSILKSGVHVDLLFSDVVMPGNLRSPELARQAKLLLPNIAVLFTSGYTQNAIVHGGRLDPGVHLLSKPYRREQLAKKVRSLLED
ncbi:ATP-binding protein [uncultured Oxalicibacterium sp.]|uniref:ATP-binding protein n=1 Tax=uncultured Oxalicibacterium sp. TaxID=1168540 RepID=UPI003453B4F4